MSKKIYFADIELQAVQNASCIWQAKQDRADLRKLCEKIKEENGRIISLWGEDVRDQNGEFCLKVAFVIAQGLIILSFSLPANDCVYPDISDIFPAANRMSRATFDLLGIRAENSADQRSWLRHNAWDRQQFPLRCDFVENNTHETHAPYPFVHVSGEGVHEIGVGPIHAGIIEPGHFHFSVIGEHILRLEEHLGYTHKGIEKRFEAMSLTEGVKLAGRVSGDSTVAYAFAYSQAVEHLTHSQPSRRALWIRALLLERERIMNHLGDLGALGNDGGLAFGLAQFSRLKEDMLRLNQQLFQHRYLMDRIVPGGVVCDIDQNAMDAMRHEINELRHEVNILKDIYDHHSGLQDRFLTSGIVSPELAKQLGLTGLAGRASGQNIDLRVQFPHQPYDELEVSMVTRQKGDVAARVEIRFAEIMESLKLLNEILLKIPDGKIYLDIHDAKDHAMGVGWVEGFRGELFVAIVAGEKNKIRRAHVHDPSWQNWPLIEHAVMNNIVPDFPLINKSFNLSYSGCDL